MAATAHLTVVAPDNEKFTVQSAPARLPRRKPNAEYRSREHLTGREVERLIEAMKGNRWGHRDATMVLIAFRHGLRASELVDLHWDQIDLEHALLHVRKLKNGSPATHPLTGRELRALRRLQREQNTKSPFVFTSERGTPFTKRGFQAMVERVGEAAGFDITSWHAHGRHDQIARRSHAEVTVAGSGTDSLQCPSGCPSIVGHSQFNRGHRPISDYEHPPDVQLDAGGA